MPNNQNQTPPMETVLSIRLDTKLMDKFEITGELLVKNSMTYAAIIPKKPLSITDLLGEASPELKEFIEDVDIEFDIKNLQMFSAKEDATVPSSSTALGLASDMHLKVLGKDFDFSVQYSRS